MAWYNPISWFYTPGVNHRVNPLSTGIAGLLIGSSLALTGPCAYKRLALKPEVIDAPVARAKITSDINEDGIFPDLVVETNNGILTPLYLSQDRKTWRSSLGIVREYQSYEQRLNQRTNKKSLLESIPEKGEQGIQSFFVPPVCIDSTGEYRGPMPVGDYSKPAPKPAPKN